MRSQIICDRCKKSESDFMSTPKGWERIHDRDLCPDCLKLYNKSWKQKIDKVDRSHQEEINAICIERDTNVETMFKTFLMMD